MTKFYITTPLYYVNDKPHLGTAYATVNSDVLARYHKLFSHDVKFLTGTDEHGLKVQQTAEKRGKAPQDHCDELSKIFQESWKNLEVNYDIFFRTTDSFHKSAVQAVLQTLFDRGDIYSASYQGWYSVSEEIFYTEKDLVDGKSPLGNEVTRVDEKNYFFKMSKYQQPLIDYIEKNPKFIQPDNRRNETLGFLRQPLEDLCISRPKSRLNWGIEIPFDTNYVTYVWFDALLNYATGVGFMQPEREAEFKKWWIDAGAHHIIGKDILITHSVYWTTMLLALNIPLPKKIFATGWILNKDNEKMSKSRGSVMDAVEMAKLVGIEPLRYFLAREFRFGQDGPASQELIVNRVNTDLANNIGNLLSRTTNLIDKFFSGKAPEQGAHDESTAKLIELACLTPQKVFNAIHDFSPNEAIEHVMALLTETNKFLEDKAPWKLAKTDLKTAGEHLYIALEILRISASLLLPVMPNKMSSLLGTLGISEPKWSELSKWGLIQAGSSIKKAEPLFPRIEIEKVPL